MIYLIRIYFILLITFNSSAYAIENNKILFKINNKIFTNIDYERRIDYIEIINNLEFSKLDTNQKKFILEDYISTQIFYEHNIINEYVYKDLEKEIDDFFNRIILEKISDLNDKERIKYLKNNVKSDLVRRKIIERLLNKNKILLTKTTENLDLIYNYNLNLIIINSDFIDINEINKIKNRNDFETFKKIIENNNIDFYFKNEDINDKSIIADNIKDIIEKNIKIKIVQNSNYYSIFSLVKNLESYDGVFVKLVSYITNKLIDEKNLNCSFLESIKDKIRFNEYEYSKLNVEIKNNLKSINDYIILNQDNNFNYIFLCELRYDKDLLNKIDSNKKINSLAKDLEIEFINIHKLKYKLERYDE